MCPGALSGHGLGSVGSLAVGIRGVPPTTWVGGPWDYVTMDHHTKLRAFGAVRCRHVGNRVTRGPCGGDVGVHGHGGAETEQLIDDRPSAEFPTS